MGVSPSFEVFFNIKGWHGRPQTFFQGEGQEPPSPSHHHLRMPMAWKATILGTHGSIIKYNFKNERFNTIIIGKIEQNNFTLTFTRIFFTIQTEQLNNREDYYENPCVFFKRYAIWSKLFYKSHQLIKVKFASLNYTPYHNFAHDFFFYCCPVTTHFFSIAHLDGSAASIIIISL